MPSDFDTPPGFGTSFITPRHVLILAQAAAGNIPQSLPPPTDPDHIADLESQLAAAQTALDDAVTALAAAQAGMHSAATAYSTAQQPANDVGQALLSAYQSVFTIQRRIAAQPPTASADDLAAAQAAIATTSASGEPLEAAAATAQQAWQLAPTALATAKNNVGLADGVVRGLQDQLNGVNRSYSSAGWQVVVRYDDASRAGIVYLNARIQARGQIVTTDNSSGIALLAYEPIEPETLDLTAAVQQLDTSWILTGAAHPFPADGKSHEVRLGFVLTDDPVPPNTPGIAAAQVIAATRSRQGWSEFLTPPGQAAPRRYLTMTASNGAGTPPGKTYSGALRFAPPPPDYDPYNYPPLDPDTWQPSPGYPTIYPGSFSGVGGQHPLVIYSTLSADALNSFPRVEDLFPDTLDAVTDNASLLSATTRLMSKPLGLLWTLSEEQAPEEIQEAVQTAVGDGWPSRQVFYSTQAVNVQSVDGDFASVTKLRFKLSYGWPNPPVLVEQNYEPSIPGESVAFHWAYRRRNLDTGAVTIEAHSTTIAFPVFIPAAAGIPATYRFEYTDADWTVVMAAENETVELVMGNV